MMTHTPILLLMDIDGVIAQSPPVQGKLVRFDAHYSGYPVPLCIPLLRAIAQSRHITPYWLSTWGGAAQHWNHYAGVAPWPWVYPNQSLTKCGAAQAITRHWGGTIIWIEDGFLSEDREWAAQDERVKLIDTTGSYFQGKPSGIWDWNIQQVCSSIKLNMPS